MILYIEKSPKSKKLLEFINEFSKVVRYKINTQKTIAFLQPHNEIPEQEIKKTILFTIAWKTLKYQGKNLTKAVKYLYSENFIQRNMMVKTPRLWSKKLKIQMELHLVHMNWKK